MRKETRILLLTLALSFFLVWALGSHPYSYYMNLRNAILFGGGYLAYELRDQNIFLFLVVLIVALFNPISEIKNVVNCSVMFITVQNEELFKNSDHAGLAFETYTGNKKLVEIPKAAHYDIYSGPAKDMATKLAIEWFSETLKN